MIALIVGTALALAALSFVLYPLIVPRPEPAIEPSVRFSHTDSPRSIAVDALREIEFDRATGKLSDTDYSELKASYTRRAIEAMRAGGAVICERCGPRPEADARFCSNCGATLGNSA